MQTFEVFWWRWLLAMGVTAIVLVIFLFLGFYLPLLPGRPPARRARTEKWPAGIEETPRGTPPVLILLYVIMGLYIIGHTLYLWLVKTNY